MPDATLDTAVGAEFSDCPAAPSIDLGCAPGLAWFEEPAGEDDGAADDPAGEDDCVLVVGADERLVADGDDTGDAPPGAAGTGVAAELGVVAGGVETAAAGGIWAVDSAAGGASPILPEVSGAVGFDFGEDASAGDPSTWRDSPCGDGESVDDRELGVGFEDDSSWAGDPRSGFDDSLPMSGGEGDSTCCVGTSDTGDADGAAACGCADPDSAL